MGSLGNRFPAVSDYNTKHFHRGPRLITPNVENCNYHWRKIVPTDLLAVDYRVSLISKLRKAYHVINLFSDRSPVIITLRFNILEDNKISYLTNRSYWNHSTEILDNELDLRISLQNVQVLIKTIQKCCHVTPVTKKSLRWRFANSKKTKNFIEKEIRKRWQTIWAPEVKIFLNRVTEKLKRLLKANEIISIETYLRNLLLAVVMNIPSGNPPLNLPLTYR